MNNLKEKNKILYLGPKGSYTEIAASKFIKHYDLNCIQEPISTIKKIIQEVNDNDYLAVIPIENSIEGIVRETVDALLNVDDLVKIYAQLSINISHCLISKGKKENIKTILSHPQALNQCQGYIAENFGKDINIMTVNSTSYATMSLKNLDDTYASIGNEFCANLYGIDVVDRGINDVKDNRTRFILIGKLGYNDKADRTSIAFTTKNEPGALLKVLEIFKEHDLNLVYLESRPSKEIIGNYVFFADIDKGIKSIMNALNKISDLCEFCKILGSYASKNI